MDATEDPMMRICYKYVFQKWFFNLKALLLFYGLKRNGFLGTKQLQSFDSFRWLFVIKSKKKQVTIKITSLTWKQIFIIKWMKMKENDKNSKKIGKKQFLIRK